MPLALTLVACQSAPAAGSPAPPVPSVSSPGSSAASGFRREEVLFPANEIGKTEENAYLFEKTFALQIDLPEGWTLKTPGEGEPVYAAGLYSPMNLYAGDRVVGTVAFNRYDAYPAVAEQTFYRSVYRQLMGDAKPGWDNEYTPVRETECAVCATCKVTDGAAERKAILAYHRAILSYIAIEFADDAVTDAQWRAIAESVSLEPAIPPAA